jgi:hypothetical protein
MIRAQVQLTEEQAVALRRIAARRRVSTASLVREAVARFLGGTEAPAPVARAKAAIGAFHSGDADGATEHDRHLDGAYSD